VQIEQLQSRMRAVSRSASTLNRIAPQWHLPECEVFMVVPMESRKTWDWGSFGFLMLLVGAVAGCEGPPPMTPAEIEQATQGQSEVFVEVDGKLTLDDTREFYLGQPRDAAEAALEERCEAIVDYKGDWRRAHTNFRGCRLPDDPDIESIRIGFHPEIDDRVFTLEVKRRGYTPELVRARFSQRFGDEVTLDVPRRGTVRMETARHLMFGSWDEGKNGTVHLVFGLSPDAVESMSK
jgi:hypothetical protein